MNNNISSHILKASVFLFFSVVFKLSAQETFISGQVSDVRGLPIGGASVIEKDTSNGIATDFEGNFKIKVKSEKAILVFSYIGYQELELPASDGMQVNLEEQATGLDEVVVLGYGSQKKEVLTSAVSTLSGNELTKVPVANVTQQLQGKSAGVQIIAADAPGTSSVVIIRGLGTALGGRTPLYVVDGVLTDNINNINSADIESMSVLKDAASLAIYGNRGANGVIMITTKKPQIGKMKVSVDVYTGFRNILNKVKMADASQYITYTNEATDRLVTTAPKVLIDPSRSNVNTDWIDAITQTGRISNYNISLSGGNEKVRAFFSSAYITEEGILPGDTYDRLTLRNNLEYHLTDKVKFSHNVSVQFGDRSPQNYGRFSTAYKQAPIVPVKDDQGRWGSSKDINNVGNPAIGNTYSPSKVEELKLQGSFRLDYSILDYLTFTSRFSIQSEYNKNTTFNDALGAFLAQTPSFTENDFKSPNKTSLEVRQEEKYRWFSDNFFTFNKTFNDVHNIDATMGITAENIGSEYLFGKRVNVPLDTGLRYTLDNGDGGATQEAKGAVNIPEKLHSYIFRANYAYANKYLLGGSYRRDGSSKFQEGFRYGDFYAISGGWVVTQEKFIKNMNLPLDIIKIRASYGQLGNQNVPTNILTAATGSDVLYPFGINQTIQTGTTVKGVIQNNLSWEVTKEYDIGIEYTLFDYRLKGEIDYYNRTNTNAILPLQLPSIFGFDPFNDHVGEVLNEGVEISLNWSSQISDDLSYSIGGNFTYNKNELTKVLDPYFNKQQGGEIDNGQYTKYIDVGQPIGSFYLYEQRGIDTRGNIVYSDLNNDGNIDENDRRFFGSYIPKMYFGLNLSMNYKNIDFSMEAFGNIGNQLYNGKKAQRFSGENIEESVVENRWTPTNFGSDPAPFHAVPISSNYYLESGDFYRINTITIGYTIPKNIFKWGHLRFYITSKNPFIYQKFSGFNPELPGNQGGSPLGTSGIELNSYPALRSFYGGFNLSF